jgi:hypothetical protein
MTLTRRLTLSLLMLLTAHMAVMAQEDPEYRAEIGAGAGVMSYMGDFGGGIFKQMQPAGAIVAKYKMNPRMAWGANLSFGKLKGKSEDNATWYPDYATTPVEFSTTVTTLDVRFEYNFWPFGTGREYRGAKQLTPFIAAGMGLAFAKCEESVGAFEVPMGIGIKYKLADRLNLTAEWMIHFTGTDRLDGVRDPYGIKSSGMFKNTDCYTSLQLSLTYDLWAKCKTCHNDDE